MTISGRHLVSTRVCPGMVGFLKKSKLICQSEALLVSRIDVKVFGPLDLESPFFYKTNGRRPGRVSGSISSVRLSNQAY